MGLRAELRNPSHWVPTSNHSGVLQSDKSQNGTIKAFMKNGSQQSRKQPVMMARVRAAFRSRRCCCSERLRVLLWHCSVTAGRLDGVFCGLLFVLLLLLISSWLLELFMDDSVRLEQLFCSSLFGRAAGRSSRLLFGGSEADAQLTTGAMLSAAAGIFAASASARLQL